jgi:hypothetical protein
VSVAARGAVLWDERQALPGRLDVGRLPVELEGEPALDPASCPRVEPKSISLGRLLRMPPGPHPLVEPPDR